MHNKVTAFLERCVFLESKHMTASNKTVTPSASSVTITVDFTPAEAQLLRALAQAEHNGDVGAYIREGMKSITAADVESFASESKLAFA